jgi:hypothetical protein
VTETTPPEKARNAPSKIPVPIRLALPVLLILGLPAVLCLSVARPRSLSHYPEALWATLEWAGIPGRLLLGHICPTATEVLDGFFASYIVPLGLLGTVVAFVLIKRSVPKYRAVWLGFAWSVFTLQLLGTIPMAYLWAIGV